VALGPHVGAPRRGQERRDRVADHVGAGRPEAHHRDVGARGRHRQPLNGLGDADDGTPASLATGFNTSVTLGVNGVNTEAETGTQVP